MIRASVYGRLGGDPIGRATRNGKPPATASLAVDATRADAYFTSYKKGLNESDNASMGAKMQNFRDFIWALLGAGVLGTVVFIALAKGV